MFSEKGFRGFTKCLLQVLLLWFANLPLQNVLKAKKFIICFPGTVHITGTIS